jgi:hypothetical protein
MPHQQGFVMVWAPDNRVTHAQYGDGTVVSTNEYHTVIDFDGHGLRRFSTPRVVLSEAMTPAPPKPVKKPRAKRASTSTA